jgi:hypothetical protein
MAKARFGGPRRFCGSDQRRGSVAPAAVVEAVRAARCCAPGIRPSGDSRIEWTSEGLNASATASGAQCARARPAAELATATASADARRGLLTIRSAS